MAVAEAKKLNPETQAVVTLPAAEAFEGGMGGSQVQHDFASGGVALCDTHLVEDDSPGAGCTTAWVNALERTPEIPVGPALQLKKVLVVEDPAARDATLYVLRPGSGQILLNGILLDTPEPKDFFHGGAFWEVPPALVRKGKNEVVIRADREGAVSVKLALRPHILENNPELADRPPRSFSSADGGRSWKPLDGELTVRLRLTRHPPEGSFTSPVIDLAKTSADALGLRPVEARSFALSVDAQAPDGTGVAVLLRTGTTATWKAGSWTEFHPAGDPALAGRRYVQWKAVLTTRDPRVSPVLKQVTLTADVARGPAPDWAARIVPAACRNGRARHTSIPFAYEDPAHPRIKALREKYRLDDVVREGRTEFERMVLLRDWVARQWNWKAPEGHYPAWDAEEILARPDGMCVQFAIVLVQCYIALGWQARFVFGEHPGTMSAGHEVVEVWSNDHAKWVFMDPTSSRNEYCADPETGTPLGLLEMRDRMVAHYYPGEGPVTHEARPKSGRWCDRLALVRKRATAPSALLGSGDPVPDDWPSWTKWLFLWFIPRNDWFANPRPLPRCQGWNDWDWIDVWAWWDRRTPRLLNYARFTGRRSDVEWTINEVVFGARYGGAPATLELEMGTDTPFFETFLVRTDDGEWKPSGASFAWKLHAGANRVELRVRNTSGVLGPISFLEVDAGSPVA